MKDESDIGGRRRRGRRRGGTAAALLVVVMLALAACGGGGGGKNRPAGASGAEPSRGGTMTFAMISDPDAFDPFRPRPDSTSDNVRLMAVFDALFWPESGTGRVVPQIGESLTPDDTRTRWTLRVRPGVRFSDGTPFDAAAVKFTWDLHADPAVRSQQAPTVAGITTRVEDPLTLAITLDRPNGAFDRVVASNLSFIVSPTAWQASGQARFGQAPVGAGPFVMKEWVHGDRMVLDRNPGYWQAGRPYLDRLVLKPISDSDQILASLASGQADLNVTTNPASRAKGADRGLRETHTTVIGGQGMLFNSAAPPFDDPRARRAVALAVSAEDLIKVVYNGQGDVANGFFPPGHPLVDPSVHTNPDTDRAEAQRLLDELAAEGKPLSFTYVVPAVPLNIQSAEYLHSRITQLRNVTMRIERLAITPFQTKVAVQRDFQAALWSWYMPDPEPGLYRTFHSESAGNYIGYRSPATDQALLDLRTAPDEDTRRRALTRVAEQLRTDVPFWLYQQAVITANHRPDVTGVTMAQTGAVLVDRIGFR